MIQKFRKKPVVIDAIQYTGENSEEVFAFAQGCPEIYESKDTKGNYLGIKTLEGTMVCGICDWVIKGVNGEFYPCKPDIFLKTYEPADNPSDFQAGFNAGLREAKTTK